MATVSRGIKHGALGPASLYVKHGERGSRRAEAAKEGKSEWCYRMAREGYRQVELAHMLGVTQRSVQDHIKRARKARGQ